MGSILIMISIIALFLQYQTRQISALLHMSQIYVYFIFAVMLIVGIIMQVDARKK